MLWTEVFQLGGNVPVLGVPADLENVLVTPLNSVASRHDGVRAAGLVLLAARLDVIPLFDEPAVALRHPHVPPPPGAAVREDLVRMGGVSDTDVLALRPIEVVVGTAGAWTCPVRDLGPLEPDVREDSGSRLDAIGWAAALGSWPRWSGSGWKSTTHPR